MSEMEEKILDDAVTMLVAAREEFEKASWSYVNLASDLLPVIVDLGRTDIPDDRRKRLLDYKKRILKEAARLEKIMDDAKGRLFPYKTGKDVN